MASLCLPGLENHKYLRYYLNMNESENAIKYLINNPQYIDWSILSSNPYALNLLKENEHLIVWSSFCKNPNPEMFLF